MKERVAGLDALKAIATIMVVIYHLSLMFYQISPALDLTLIILIEI